MSNNMKNPKEKEIIVKKYINGESPIKLSLEYNINVGRLFAWRKKYEKEGINGLISNTGKHPSKQGNKGIYLRKPRNKIEELELEIMKKDIEIARLKKGYMVKGVGAKKEYITSLGKNTK